MAWERQWDYDQGKDRRWPAIGLGGGVCYALSMYWIVKWSKGEDYLAWLSPPKEASSQGKSTFGVGQLQSIKKLMENQSKFLGSIQHPGIKNQPFPLDDLPARTRKLAYAKLFIEGNSDLKAQGRLVLLQGAPLDQIAAAIVANQGYVMLGWFKDGFGGHACAAYVGSPDVWFFEPNFGQYWFSDTGSFKTWYRSYMCMNYRLNSGTTDAGAQHYT
jgi:hypothetical protein